jgi:hypothetical protein
MGSLVYRLRNKKIECSAHHFKKEIKHGHYLEIPSSGELAVA